MSTTVGMVVDAMSEVLRVPVEAIELPAPVVTAVDSAFIRVIAKVDERLIILIDLSRGFRTRNKPACARCPKPDRHGADASVLENQAFWPERISPARFLLMSQLLRHAEMTITCLRAEQLLNDKETGLRPPAVCFSTESTHFRCYAA